MKKRVVVTGIGVLSPNGIGKEAFFEGIISGKSGVRKVTAFDVSPFRSQIAAQITDFSPYAFGLTKEEVERMDRYVQFAIAGTEMAIEDAKLFLDKEQKDRVGVCLANAICGTKYMEEEFVRVTNGGKEPIDPRKARPYLYDASMFNTPSSEISARYQLKGICTTVSTGCTAGTDAVGFAYEAIQNSEADIMITGASEAPLCPITFAAFDVLNVISSRNEEPEKASRPFDKERDGFVLSEGCGILILEELNHALKRGAHIYCEITGFGTCCNAYHMTDLPADGESMVASINFALKDAQLPPKSIGYINAHGSSTKQNDIFETNAYKKVFGNKAYDIPISSLKSMIGHPLAAANSIELVASVLIFERDILPPTINQEVSDPVCDLDYIANKARETRVDHILKTSSGFAGVHSSMILSRWNSP
ncbi:Actinorhodin polyketide putative beta-ketoacyl synthase 1 [Candidatus Methanoperedenaceae archaeon GB50]|nr:Actinorhodin polyketide putative beta-ketoacyl synthase 1 [Candidatus Methanoperedenaceae archaeon GB50]